jgi:regulator of protease activity HflC (stomatin/prohibitin superfamily)
MFGEFKPWKAVAAVFAVIAAVLLVGNVIGFIGGWTSTDGGTIAVVRNGGMFDNRDVRQVIPPGSSLSFVGEYSSEHDYPAQQRYYTITSEANAGDRPGVDVVTVPTKDGVNVGVEGTMYFTLNLKKTVMTAFDNKFGTRQYPGFDHNEYYAWNGDKGWSAFLDQIVRPVIDNDLREQVNQFNCAQLVSSCALVQNQQGQASSQPPKVGGQSSNGNIAAVQKAINSSLTDDLNSTLGGNFLQGITFRLVKISLPSNVQAAVDDAQAAFAKVTEAQAQVAQANALAQANIDRQRGYAQCPACAVIDELHALPPGVTTFAPGQGFAISNK